MYHIQKLLLTSKHLIICFIIFALPGITLADNAGPIVVTIKPLYSLVAHLTEGIEKPVLLMKQMPSPHHYSMRPSERRLLADAGMIVWIGPQMESYLSKILRQQDSIIVSAIQADALLLLNKRIKDHAQHSTDNLDPHIWLSAHNAIAISRHISRQLIEHDPKNTARYQDNLHRLIEKITQQSVETSAMLKHSDHPFITYHDAFQYFEDENNLNYINSVSFDEEAGISAKHLRHIRDSIDQQNIQCLLYQPPGADIIKTLTDTTAIKAIASDPLGQAVTDYKGAWFEIMRNMTLNFKRCLNW